MGSVRTRTRTKLRLKLIFVALALVRTMKLEEISRSVIFGQNEYGSNLICIALETGLVFVEAGLNKAIAADFRKSMEERFGRKGNMLVLTHAHLDHFFGMGAFSDIKVVAAEAGRARFERFVNADYDEKTIESISQVFPCFRESLALGRPFKPDVWVKDRTSLGDESQKVIFEVVGGHSACSSSIHYVPDKVMIAGDLVQVDAYPYFGEPDTSVEKWIHILKTWESMDIDFILPGHGRPVKRDYLHGVRTFFEEMLRVLKDLKADCVPIEEAIRHEKLPTGYWGKDAIRKPSYDMSIANLYRRL